MWYFILFPLCLSDLSNLWVYSSWWRRHGKVDGAVEGWKKDHSLIVDGTTGLKLSFIKSSTHCSALTRANIHGELYWPILAGTTWLRGCTWECFSRHITKKTAETSDSKVHRDSSQCILSFIFYYSGLLLKVSFGIDDYQSRLVVTWH